MLICPIKCHYEMGLQSPRWQTALRSESNLVCSNEADDILDTIGCYFGFFFHISGVTPGTMYRKAPSADHVESLPLILYKNGSPTT